MATKKEPGYEWSCCCVMDSRVTDATSNFKCFKKLSLQSCRSMVSVEDDRIDKEDYVERTLFMRYLTNRKNEGQRQKYLRKMKEYFSGLKNNKVSTIIQKMQVNLCFEPGEFKCEDQKVFQYFFAVWLKSMGYKSEYNKKIMVEKLHFTLPKHLILDGIKFYDHLGQGFVTGLHRFYMLEQICANGWEFFCRLVETHLHKCQ